MNLEQVSQTYKKIITEVSKTFIGQQEIIEHLLISIFSNGHCLIVGVPGLGKTILVKTLSEIFSLPFKRIQFTPDLMPSDIFGTEVLDEDLQTKKHSFRFVKGPLFSNIILADELNRTPPRTQSALLEAMAERQITVGNKTYPLSSPFIVLATQNPYESEGTYPIPDAQADRFLFSLKINYLSIEDEIKMVTKTTGEEKTNYSKICNEEDILAIQKMVREVPVSQDVISYAVKIVSMTRNSDEKDNIGQWIKHGASSRASQSLVLAGKTRALLHGRSNVSIEDIKALAHPVLRHRIIPSFNAQAENINSDQIIDKILQEVK